MTDRPDLKMVPPLPAEIMDSMSDVEFGESVVEFSSTGRPWSMRDANDAEYAARRLVRARAKVDEVRRQAEEWIEQIVEWASAQTVEAREIVAWGEASLEAFARRFREETGQATLKLPSLTVKTGTTPGAVIVEDVEAFVKWALDNHPAALKVEYKPIAKTVAKLDEEIPGLTYRDDAVWVKV